MHGEIFEFLRDPNLHWASHFPCTVFGEHDSKCQCCRRARKVEPPVVFCQQAVIRSCSESVWHGTRSDRVCVARSCMGHGLTESVWLVPAWDTVWQSLCGSFLHGTRSDRVCVARSCMGHGLTVCVARSCMGHGLTECVARSCMGHGLTECVAHSCMGVKQPWTWTFPGSAPERWYVVVVSVRLFLTLICKWHLSALHDNSLALCVRVCVWLLSLLLFSLYQCRWSWSNFKFTVASERF